MSDSDLSNGKRFKGNGANLSSQAGPNFYVGSRLTLESPLQAPETP